MRVERSRFAGGGDQGAADMAWVEELMTEGGTEARSCSVLAVGELVVVSWWAGVLGLRVGSRHEGGRMERERDRQTASPAEPWRSRVEDWRRDFCRGGCTVHNVCTRMDRVGWLLGMDGMG